MSSARKRIFSEDSIKIFPVEIEVKLEPSPKEQKIRTIRRPAIKAATTITNIDTFGLKLAELRASTEAKIEQCRIRKEELASLIAAEENQIGILSGELELMALMEASGAASSVLSKLA
jgi:hypothetical protein